MCCSSIDGSSHLANVEWVLTSQGLRLEATLNGRQYEGELHPVVLPRGYDMSVTQRLGAVG